MAEALSIPVKMPQLGESVVKGTIIRWLKQPGDSVEQYEPLVEIETDKVVTKVSASEPGVLAQIMVPAGEIAKVGAVLAYLKPPGEPEAEPESVAKDATSITESNKATPKPRRLTPVVRRLAQEHSIALETLEAIEGTGRGGRVTKRDVLHYIESESPATPSSDSPKPAAGPEPQPVEPGQTIELTPMRAAIAQHMLNSVQTSPHVTSVFEVDMSQVTAYRRAHKEEFARRGVNLTYTAFFAQAAVEALKAHPIANASLVDGKIRLHPHINIGIAVAVEGGLLVPVVKRAEELSLSKLAQVIDELAASARAKKLKPDDVQNGTFTVTNPGMQGALFGTAIIHQPQAAILGVGAIVKRPVVVHDDAITVRPMVYLSLTYDHRLMDGFGANELLATIRDFLQEYH